MSSKTNNKIVYGSILLGTCVIFCVAIAVEAQYNTFDSDSNSGKFLLPIATISGLISIFMKCRLTKITLKNNALRSRV